jgi:hypothetical protein
MCRYSNPSETCWQLSGQDADEYREFRGLNKQKFAFMPASEALQVKRGKENSLQRDFESFGCYALELTT